ncbi:hypothetical protein CCACVL1_02874 [Corchorus capsularis]|uniref:Uncharacterized protein n=1 Tax=Corchorus capsularis TaxID=210143 RepID=A0A1R3K524_COCAP|nr:hypothetical protein CCACVL1_02874 [Corchorus capsularis]
MAAAMKLVETGEWGLGILRVN